MLDETMTSIPRHIFHTLSACVFDEPYAVTRHVEDTINELVIMRIDESIWRRIMDTLDPGNAW